MIHFTPKQVQELIDTIENVHWFFIATRINPDLVPKRVMKSLVKMGFKKSQVMKYPELAMKFGMLSTYLKDKEVQSMTFDKLKKAIRSKKFLPLSVEEKYALENVEQRAMSDIKGLGNRISKTAHTILIEADSKQRAHFEGIIRDASVRGIKKREGIKFIASEIGDKTGDWSRDLDRISDYILHESYDVGRALAIKKQRGGTALVYKRVHKDACEVCKKVYLKNTKTWEPKIFRVDQLLVNGSNVGRKKDEWLPVIGPVHPWCRCDVVYVPAGYVWSSKTQRFVPDETIKNSFKGKVTVKVTKI